jgi:hypothetical protein
LWIENIQKKIPENSNETKFEFAAQHVLFWMNKSKLMCKFTLLQSLVILQILIICPVLLIIMSTVVLVSCSFTT